jgi:hypothetical protein
LEKQQPGRSQARRSAATKKRAKPASLRSQDMRVAGTFMVGTPSIGSNTADFRGNLSIVSRRTFRACNSAADGYMGIDCGISKAAAKAFAAKLTHRAIGAGKGADQ